MDISEQTGILDELLQAHEDGEGAGRLWEGKTKARLYLACTLGEHHEAYIYVDRDGDLVGEGPRLSRVKSRELWAKWEAAAKAIGRKLYA